LIIRVFPLFAKQRGGILSGAKEGGEFMGIMNFECMNIFCEAERGNPERSEGRG